MLLLWGRRRQLRSRTRDDQEPEGEAHHRDARGDDEDLLERAVLLLVAGGAANKLPGVVHAAGQRHGDEQRGHKPEERHDDAHEQRARGVVDLRAHPHPGDRLRSPEREAEDALDEQQQCRQQPVDAAARAAGGDGGSAVAHRGRARSPADEESTRVCGVVTRHHTETGRSGRETAPPQPSYSASISPANLSFTTLRLTLRVGVSSPVCCDRSCGRILNFLICSTRPTCELASSTAFCTSARISSESATASGSSPCCWAKL